MRSRFFGFLLIIYFFFPCQLATGQKILLSDLNPQDNQAPVSGKTSKNAIYIELAGPGVLYSVNYEHHLTKNLSIRTGFSIWSIDSLDLMAIQIKNLKFRSFPLMVNYLIGKGASHLELGLGIQPTFLKGDFDTFYFIRANDSGKGKSILGLSTIGYRYQKVEGGLIFRIGISPAFNSSGVNKAVGASICFGV